MNYITNACTSIYNTGVDSIKNVWSDKPKTIYRVAVAALAFYAVAQNTSFPIVIIGATLLSPAVGLSLLALVVAIVGSRALLNGIVQDSFPVVVLGASSLLSLETIFRLSEKIPSLESFILDFINKQLNPPPAAQPTV